MYFKINSDAVHATSKTHALEIYNKYHNTNETNIKEVSAVEEIDFFDENLPHIRSSRYLQQEATTISEIFWYYCSVSIIEGMFK